MMGESLVPMGGSLAKAIPQRELPKVGDTMILHFQPYGGIYEVKEGQQITNGAEYVEVEVKAIKKAKVSFE